MSVCLAECPGVGRHRLQGTGGVYAAAAARLMTRICVSRMIRAHQAADAAETDSASSLTVIVSAPIPIKMRDSGRDSGRARHVP